MEMDKLAPLQETLARYIDPDARKALEQYFVAFRAAMLSDQLPRVTVSTTAEDKFLFGTLSAFSDLITALNAEPEGDEPQADSNDGVLL